MLFQTESENRKITFGASKAEFATLKGHVTFFKKDHAWSQFLHRLLHPHAKVGLTFTGVVELRICGLRVNKK